MDKVRVTVKQVQKVEIKQPPEVAVRLGRSVSVSDDYLRLSNKPKINGAELSGDMTAADLSLLPVKQSEYQEICLGAAGSGSFLVVLTTGKQAKKMRLTELTEGRIKTAEDIPGDLQVGNYVFLLKGEK